MVNPWRLWGAAGIPRFLPYVKGSSGSPPPGGQKRREKKGGHPPGLGGRETPSMWGLVGWLVDWFSFNKLILLISTNLKKFITGWTN